MRRVLAAVTVVAAMMMVVAVFVIGALSGPPPASWERDNPAKCPYPHEDRKPPMCELFTPDTGIRPIPAQIY